MVSDQAMARKWPHYDSYRPLTKREAFSENRSPTIAEEPNAVRHSPDHSSHGAKYSSNTAPQGGVSSTPKSPRGQSEDQNSPHVLDENPPSTGHDPESLIPMPTKKQKGRPNTAPSPRSSRVVDKRNRSEAQSRGIYGSSRSPTSNVARLGIYELKRPQDNEATNPSIKRRRDTEEDDHDKDDFELDQSKKSQPRACTPQPPTEPASFRTRKELFEHAHGEHSLPNKPVKLAFPSRDRSQRSQASHNVFNPRANSYHASQSRKSAPIEEGVYGTTTDRHLQCLRDTPLRDPSPDRLSGKISTSKQLEVMAQAPGVLGTPPPSSRPTISPRDPRLRRDPPLTPLVSPLQSLQMSLEPVPIEPQMHGEPPPNSSQSRTPGVGATPSQASFLQEEYQSHPPGQWEAYVPPASGKEMDHVPQASSRKNDNHSPTLTKNEDHPALAPNQLSGRSSQAPTRNEDHLVPTSTPNDHLADDGLETIEARMKAFEEEERVKQKQHEEELAKKKRQQRQDFKHELEGKINQKTHDADMARRAAVQKQEEEHKRLMAELRRR